MQSALAGEFIGMFVGEVMSRLKELKNGTLVLDNS